MSFFAMGVPEKPLSSALSPATWPFQLEWLPRPAYLVGGAVRDGLLGRRADYLDLDFVLPTGAVETAAAIAHRCGAGFVVLDAERQIARVVFERATADFAQQEGPTLEADLRRRDFTVNAIAYNPHDGELIDPLQGYPDLKQRRIRMVSAYNLQDDPLRLLRAYRQAAQLGFRIEASTQTALQQFASRIGQVAAERVQTELGYLLSTASGTQWLESVWRDGLLSIWLPDTRLQGLHYATNLDWIAARLQIAYPAFAAEIWRSVRERAPGAPRTWLVAAKLAGLLSPDLKQAETQLLRLKYSRAEIRATLPVRQYLSEGDPVATLADLSLRQQYFFFQAVGVAFPGVAIAAIAKDRSNSTPSDPSPTHDEFLAAPCPPASQADWQAIDTRIESIAPLIQRFLTPNDPVAHPVPLIAGRALMKALQLSPGPHIGQLLQTLQVAQAEGKIATTEDAIAFATQYLKRENREKP